MAVTADQAAIDAQRKRLAESQLGTPLPTYEGVALMPPDPNAGFPNLAAAQADVDKVREELTAEIARRGREGRAAFEQRQGQIEAARQAALSATSARLTRLGAPDALAEASAIINAPIAQRQASLAQQAAIFDEDFTRQGASNSASLARQSAAIPAQRERMAGDIARQREEFQNELTKLMLEGAGGKKGGGGKGGGGGGGRGGDFDPLGAQWRATAHLTGQNILDELARFNLGGGKGAPASDIYGDLIGLIDSDSPHAGSTLDQLAREIERNYPGAGQRVRNAAAFLSDNPGIDPESALGLAFLDDQGNPVKLQNVQTAVRGTGSYKEIDKLVDRARATKAQFDALKRDKDGNPVDVKRADKLLGDYNAAKQAANAKLRQLERSGKSRAAAVIRKDKNLKKQ